MDFQSFSLQNESLLTALDLIVFVVWVTDEVRQAKRRLDGNIGADAAT